MNRKELNKKVEELNKRLESEDLTDKEKNTLKKELSYYNKLEKLAVGYSESVNDPDTAVELYSTKQLGLFIALSEGVCRRIRKGYYATKQRYLINDLNSGNLQRIRHALDILRFDISKFKDINWSNIKFEMIVDELDKGFWSF